MTESCRLLRRGRHLLCLLAILALLLGTLPALAFEYAIPRPKSIFTEDKTCRFEWTPTEDAVEYLVYRRMDSGERLYLTSTANHYILDSDLAYDHKYFYSVIAVYSSMAYSERSEEMSTIPLEPPTILKCEEYMGSNSITVFLEFTEEPGASRLEITRKGSDNSSMTTIVNNSHHDQDNLQAGVTYQYTAKGLGHNSRSRASDSKSVTIFGKLEQPKVTAKVVGKTVTLTWKPVPLAVRYAVHRFIDGDENSYMYYPVTTTSFTQSNLPYDKLYTYRVWPYAANGATSYWPPAVEFYLLRPPVLTGLSEYGPPTMPAVKLSWNAVNHADSYQVYRSVNGGAYAFLKGTTALSINDNSVQLGKTYYYKVKAIEKIGGHIPAEVESYPSALRGVRVVGVLAAPAISSLSSASNSAYLKWAPVAGAKSYAIYRSVNGGAFQFLKGTTGLSIADAGLTFGALYSYRVQAKADSGAASPMSASRSIRIPAQPATPVISSLSLAGTTATLAWGKVNGAVSYYVYRSVNGGAYSFLKGTTATFIKDNNLETGKTYAYRVRANANAGVYSALSAARSIKVAALATPVIASLANGGTTTATLTWGKVNGATCYTIYRSVNGGAYSFLKGTTALFIKDAGLAMGSSYAYRVQANGAGGLTSALSAARSITIK